MIVTALQNKVPDEFNSLASISSCQDIASAVTNSNLNNIKTVGIAGDVQGTSYRISTTKKPKFIYVIMKTTNAYRIAFYDIFLGGRCEGWVFNNKTGSEILYNDTSQNYLSDISDTGFTITISAGTSITEPIQYIAIY